MSLYCDECNKMIHDPCYAEYDGATLLCGDCVACWEEKMATGKRTSISHLCGQCERRPAYTEKNEGLRCIQCAHEIEVSLCPSIHNATQCTICLEGAA